MARPLDSPNSAPKPRGRITLVSPINRAGRRHAAIKAVPRGNVVVVEHAAPPKPAVHVIPTRQPTPVTPQQIQHRQARHQIRLKAHRQRVAIKKAKLADRGQFDKQHRALTVAYHPELGTSAELEALPRGLHLEPGYKPTTGESELGAALDTGVNKAAKVVSAPAVAALKVAAIPNHFIARNADKLLTGKDPGSHATFSDVLKDAGVHNKTVRAIAGFGADVATDPTTYLTLGAGPVLRKGAEEAAAKGVTETAAKDATRGVKLGVRAHVPFTDKTFKAETSGRATAAAGRKIKASKLGRAGTKVNAHVRDTLHETVAPDVTPSYRTPQEHQAIRSAERKARAQQNTGERKVTRRVRALDKAGTPEEHAQAVRQLEAGTAHTAEPKIAAIARTYKREHTAQFRAKQKRGLLGEPFKPETPDDARVYFPHVNAKVLNKDTGRIEGQFSVKAAKDKGRKIRLPLHEANAQAKGFEFIAHGPTAHGIQSIKNLRQQVRSDLWQAVAKTGRKLTPDTGINHATERVYEVTPHGLRPLEHANGAPDETAIEKAATSDGNYVVLNKKSVDNVAQPGKAAMSSTKFGRGVDRVTGVVKRIDTKFNPSFQPRNLYGDSMLAFQADTTLKSGAQALRAMRALHRRNVAQSSSEAVLGKGENTAKAEALLNRPVKGVVVDGRPVTYGEAIVAAEEHGAINSGFVGQELRDLLGGTRVKKGLVFAKDTRTKLRIREKVKTGSGGSTVSSVNEYRENLPRFATFLQALKDGKNFDQAAQHSLKSHIDYGDLTQIEQRFNRRAIPFYTFFARNTRIQMTNIIRRPGKITAIAHLYDEASKAAGYNSYQDYAGGLPDSQQRGLPLPVHIGGHTYPIYLSPPQTDINQASVNPSTQFQNVLNRVSFFKVIPEVLLNYSVFFQGQIQNPDRPRVPAPGGVQHLPGPIRNLLGVKQIMVRGRKVWGWYAKADYISRTLPQSNFAVSVAKPSPDQRGLNGWVALGSYLTGVRVGPDKAQDNQVNALYTKLNRLTHTLNAYHQTAEGGRKDPKGHYVKTPFAVHLQDQINKLNGQIGSLRVKRGDPANTLPSTQRPSRSSGGSIYGGSSGSSIYGSGSGSIYGSGSTSIYGK